MKLQERIAEASQRQELRTNVPELKVNLKFGSDESMESNKLPTTQIMSVADEISKLGELQEKGLISEKEFCDQKQKLLNQATGISQNQIAKKSSTLIRILKWGSVLLVILILIVMCGPRHQLSVDEQECQRLYKGELRQKCLDDARARELDRQTADQFEKIRRESIR
jgi:hypothetical protein